MITINKAHAREEGTIYFTVSYKNQNGTAVTPTSLTWSISDPRGVIINGRKNVTVTTPAASNEICAYGDDLALNSNEVSDLVERRFTTKAMVTIGGESRPVNEEARFWIEAMIGVS